MLQLSAWALLASVFSPLLPSFAYNRPACVNVFVCRVVQTRLPEFGTLLAHIWPKSARVGGFGDLLNLFGFIVLEWSHPPGSNRRPADYESAALPTELGWPSE